MRCLSKNALVVAAAVIVCTLVVVPSHSGESRGDGASKISGSAALSKIEQMLDIAAVDTAAEKIARSATLVPVDSLPYSVKELVDDNMDSVWLVKLSAVSIHYSDRINPEAYSWEYAAKEYFAVVDPTTGAVLRIDGVSSKADSLWRHRIKVVSILDHLEHLNATLVGVACDSGIVPLVQALSAAPFAQIEIAQCVSYFPILVTRGEKEFPIWLIASYGAKEVAQTPKAVIWTCEVDGTTGKLSGVVSWWCEDDEKPKW